VGNPLRPRKPSRQPLYVNASQTGNGMAKAPRRPRTGKAPRPGPVRHGPPVADAGAAPRPTKAEMAAEKYPNLAKNPALGRALVIMRALAAGKSREEAEVLADAKVGPRAPHWVARHPPKRGHRGTRPEPDKRVRLKPSAKKPRGPSQSTPKRGSRRLG
jgi:hypothetical protein